MRHIWKAVAVAVLAALLPASAPADTSQTIEGVTIGKVDVMQLLGALHTAMKPNDATIPVFVSIKDPKDMPAYDPVWHYAGLSTARDGKVDMTIWLASGLADDAMQTAITSSFPLALCDGGYGGPNFKRLYDIYAAKDAALPADAPDPFLNRHRFAHALSDMIQAP